MIGNLSDRFGRRPIILASLFAFGVDYLLMGFAPTVTWLFVGRAIAGICGAVYVPANAFVADVTPPSAALTPLAGYPRRSVWGSSSAPESAACLESSGPARPSSPPPPWLE